MKRFSLSVCLCLILAACNDGTGIADDPADTTAGPAETKTTHAAAPNLAFVTPTPGQVHTARTSLDYVGRYQAEGGMRDDPFALQINGDGTFRMIPRNGPSVVGHFHWDETGFIITLEDDGKPLARFFVAENRLKRLDSGPSEGLLLHKVLP